MAAVMSAAVKRVERREAADKTGHTFIGRERNLCPSCGRPLTFGNYYARCDYSVSHYTRVELPRPTRGEVFGLPGQPWGLLYPARRASEGRHAGLRRSAAVHQT